MSSWSHLNDVCVPTPTFEVIIKSCHSRSKSQEAIICMISLSVFQKFFGPLFILPSSYRWGFSTKFWADSVCCFLCWASPSHQCSKSKDSKVVKSQMCSKPHWKNLKGTKCTISWKVKLVTFKFSLRRTSQNTNYEKQLLFSPVQGIEKKFIQAYLSYISQGISGFSAHILKIGALFCSENAMALIKMLP